MKNRALFLDRDGVINFDLHHVHKSEDFHFIPGVFEALLQAQNMGYLLIVVTNQAGIGKNMYTEEDFLCLDAWMNEEFQAHGIEISRTYYCPHHPEASNDSYKKKCDCRKPNPGMILQASEDFAIDLKQSVLIGDKATDLETALNAGVMRSWLFPALSKDDIQGKYYKAWNEFSIFLKTPIKPTSIY
jgi:D-glycero-D-manno-heptose 1,7-bisphosphate phosphatase